jgi:hypothetical protein
MRRIRCSVPSNPLDWEEEKGASWGLSERETKRGGIKKPMEGWNPLKALDKFDIEIGSSLHS